MDRTALGDGHCRTSRHDLTTWVAAGLGLDELDAYQLLSQAGEAPLANVVDPRCTAVAELAKRSLPGVDVHDGVHARLRDTGRAYLAQREPLDPARPGDHCARGGDRMQRLVVRTRTRRGTSSAG